MCIHFYIQTSNHMSIGILIYKQLKKNYLNKKKQLFSELLLNSGWLMGLEPTTLGTTNQYSNQLSYNHRIF